ncbi:hypothetical protein YC2023_022175 [Brassica napus]
MMSPMPSASRPPESSSISEELIQIQDNLLRKQCSTRDKYSLFHQDSIQQKTPCVTPNTNLLQKHESSLLPKFHLVKSLYFLKQELGNFYVYTQAHRAQHSLPSF